MGEQVRLVCLADLHVREQGPREQALPELVKSLNPDIIVYPGDFFTHASDSAACVERQLTQTLSEFSKPTPRQRAGVGFSFYIFLLLIPITLRHLPAIFKKFYNRVYHLISTAWRIV